MLVCPIILLILSIGIPAESISVPNVCLAMCIVRLNGSPSFFPIVLNDVWKFRLLLFRQVSNLAGSSRLKSGGRQLNTKLGFLFSC